MKQNVFFCEESNKLTINKFIEGLNERGYEVVQLIYEGKIDGFRHFMILTNRHVTVRIG